ncbi:MAG: hypothetical protein WCK78_04335 [Paludibacter sp.]
MKIYTSYFAKAGALKKLDIVPIGIALSPPKFFNGPTIGFLAPKRYMLSDKLSSEQYTELYKKDILGSFDIKLFRSVIKNFSNGKDVALLCYEKPGDFCHRRLFAEFVKAKFNYDIEEYVFESAKPEEKKTAVVQPTLFE